MKLFSVLSLFLFACTTVMAQVQISEPETVYYDGYLWGIHSFELEITGENGSVTYTVRRKNLAENQWGKPISVPESILGERDDFQFSGSLSGFASSLASLSGINWGSVEAVGWPNAHTLYVRHRKITEPVNGQMESAYYWAVKDGSMPMVNQCLWIWL